MTETATEKNYRVKERAEGDAKQHGSIQRAIDVLKAKLDEMDALWSRYSCDCLGHGITCTRLKISWLERMLANN